MLHNFLFQGVEVTGPRDVRFKEEKPSNFESFLITWSVIIYFEEKSPELGTKNCDIFQYQFWNIMAVLCLNSYRIKGLLKKEHRWKELIPT